MRRNIKDNLEKILNGEIEIFYGASLRYNIINSNIFEYKCSKCNLNNWLGEKILLEIDHLDGNHWNNKKENLRFLCPNCHSITKNYKGKNIKKGKVCIKGNEEQIVDLIKQGKNIKEILDSLNLKVGDNYKLIYKILKDKNIDLPKKENKSILRKNVEKQKIENKLNNLKQKIELIKNSQINFDKRGWGKEVGKLLNITPSAALKFVKRELPDFASKCFKHES